MTDPITESLLEKLATIRCPQELRGFAYGLRKYRDGEPPVEVARAVARKKIELGLS